MRKRAGGTLENWQLKIFSKGLALLLELPGYAGVSRCREGVAGL